jgi:short-subunit dehydrogenase
MNNTPVAIVTGASRGLGAAVACWLGKVGAAVTLIARSEEKLNETGDEVRRLGGEPLVCRADVSQYDLKIEENWSRRQFRPAPLPGWRFMHPGN